MVKHTSLSARSNISLLSAALIWGFAFVAQREGGQHLGPLTFNGIRFLLGALTLLPLLVWVKPVVILQEQVHSLLLSMLIAGPVLMIASTFQQLGLLYTTAGNAGFITSLYIIFVPVFGFLRRQPSSALVWVGALVASAGLYLLSVKPNFQMQTGDLLVFISSIFWAMHVIVLSYLSPGTDFRVLAFGQFLFTGLMSLVLGFFFENPEWDKVQIAWIPLVYAGVFSAGIGFTLQVYGQRHARADHAALLLSLESVVAAFGGWLILSEQLDYRQLTGCLLMLVGVLFSQGKLFFKPESV